MLVDDVDGAERVAHHHHGKNRQGQRDFVTDRLGRGPQATQQRVLVVGGVATHQQTDRLDAAQRNPEEDADPHIADQQVLAKGHHQPAEDDGHQHQHRAEGEQQAIGPRWDDIFLEQQLHAIGQGLKHPQGAGVLRANALLHGSRNLALEPNVDQHAHHRCHQHQHHRQGQPEQVRSPWA